MGNKPYQYMNHYPLLKIIDETLYIPISEVEENKTDKGDLNEFLRKYTKERTINLPKDKNGMLS